MSKREVHYFTTPLHRLHCPENRSLFVTVHLCSTVFHSTFFPNIIITLLLCYSLWRKLWVHGAAQYHKTRNKHKNQYNNETSTRHTYNNTQHATVGLGVAAMCPSPFVNQFHWVQIPWDWDTPPIPIMSHLQSYHLPSPMFSPKPGIGTQRYWDTMRLGVDHCWPYHNHSTWWNVKLKVRVEGCMMVHRHTAHFNYLHFYTFCFTQCVHQGQTQSPKTNYIEEC